MSTIGKSLIRGAKDALRYAHGQKNSGKTYKIKTNKTEHKHERKSKLNMHSEMHAP